MSVIKFIKKSTEYSQFKQNSNKFVFPAFVLLFFPNKALKNNEVAVGIIASSKVGNSVLRHKAKRRLRNICNSVLEQSNLSGFSICIIARKPVCSLPYQKIKDSFIHAVDSINN